jgi:hypothetical protein
MWYLIDIYLRVHRDQRGGDQRGVQRYAVDNDTLPPSLPKKRQQMTRAEIKRNEDEDSYGRPGMMHVTQWNILLGIYKGIIVLGKYTVWDFLRYR